jgi:aryl-alcohol dehydrogenase-like predicted oxidoreductase
MTFGEEWGFGAGKDVCREIFDAYAEAGGNFIDSANHYTGGSAERIVGELIAGRRDQFVVATKYTLNPRPDDPNAGGNHRKSMVTAIEASLKRLGTDYIDLYWLHAWDFMTPVDEVLRGLDDLVRSGKVHYIGISDTPAWVIARANTMAELRGWTSFAALQTQYSLIERTSERELLPMAEELDLAVTAWGALGGGVLTGKYHREDVGGKDDARFANNDWGSYLSEKNFAIADEVAAVAKEVDRPPSQVALSWVRQRPGVVIPIVGARKVSQIRDNLACLELSLTDEQIARLDQASHIDRGFPHDFLSSGGVTQLVYGATLPQIDNHRRRSSHPR